MKRYFPIMIFTSALTLRLVYLGHIASSPFFYPAVRGLDPYLYHEWATQLSQGFWPGENLLFGLPLYPYVLSQIYSIFGADTYLVRLIQISMGALSSLMIYFIGKYVFNNFVGILASIGAAIYGPFLFHEGQLMPSALTILLNCGGLLALLSLSPKPLYSRSFLAGLLLGCSALTAAGILPFVFLAAMWLAVTLRLHRNKKAAFHILCFLLAFLLPAAFLSLKHFLIERKLPLFAAHGGINFYIGNNPSATGTFSAISRFTPSARGLIKDSVELAQKAVGKDLEPFEVSSFWYRKGLSFIKNQPISWLRLSVKKVLLFWNRVELGDVEDYYFLKNYSPILRYNPIGFGLVGPLGLFGIVISFKLSRKTFLLYALVFSYMFSCMLFFINSRYRLPSVPALLVFAGAAIYWIGDRLRAKSAQSACLGLVAVALLGGLSSLKIITLDSVTPRHNLSIIYLQKGLYDASIAESKKILQDYPSIPAVHFNLGSCYHKKGDLEQAMAEYKEALRLKPDYKDAHYNLGLIYYKKGLFEEAEQEYSYVLALEPTDLDAHYNLGRVYEAQGLFDKAIAEYRVALSITPDLPQVKNRLEQLQDKKRSPF